jgi:DNA invertase Pin-like site-specific DNA recombinase
MKSAYLYVRVSTDEQKRKGYSLVEQEDRLLKHCEFNDIKIKGIFREDFSAKDFNRPEWKKLIKIIRKNKHRPPENILFIKWDRFSRSIEYAYQMIRTLRDLNVQAMAIDQPIDFDIPESIVMLAVYLSIPEAENCRRGLTTSDGIRRAKKMGKWPTKAPIGYANRTAPDGKKFIMPKHPEAEYIKWSFEQLATGTCTISQVMKIAHIKGLQCGRSHFWRIVRNPIYCGIIKVPAGRNEEEQYVKGIHEPLISEALFFQVQSLTNKKNNKLESKEALKSVFPLRGLLSCPWCGGKLTGSISQGKHSRYAYYHCLGNRCKGRFRAEVLNNNYEEKLKHIRLRPAAHELFNLILEDENIFTRQREYSHQRKEILSQISIQELEISKARKFFLNGKIDYDDFVKLKQESNEILIQLNIQLCNVTTKLEDCKQNNNVWPYADLNILRSYKEQDLRGKRDIISLFTPGSINPFTKDFDVIHVDKVLSLITEYCE